MMFGRSAAEDCGAGQRMQSESRTTAKWIFITTIFVGTVSTCNLYQSQSDPVHGNRSLPWVKRIQVNHGSLRRDTVASGPNGCQWAERKNRGRLESFSIHFPAKIAGQQRLATEIGESPPVANGLIWALLRFLWQGLLITIAYRTTSKEMRHRVFD